MAKPKRPPKTEGERLLRVVTAGDRSLRSIARELGVSVGALYKWSLGDMRPKPPAQADLFAKLGIPVEAWEQRTAPAAVLEPEPPGPPPSTLEDCMASLAKIRRQRNREDLSAGEQVKLATAEARLLQLRGRLERESEQRESRIVYSHPTWRRIKHLLRTTLAKHPAALKDVVAALGDAMAEDGDGPGQI